MTQKALIHPCEFSSSLSFYRCPKEAWASENSCEVKSPPAKPEAYIYVNK
jgi:hypothetical protein